MADEKREYIELSRLDILCGFPLKHPHFPCEVCGSSECPGEEEPCKEHGAYSLALTIL